MGFSDFAFLWLSRGISWTASPLPQAGKYWQRLEVWLWRRDGCRCVRHPNAVFLRNVGKHTSICKLPGEENKCRQAQLEESREPTSILADKQLLSSGLNSRSLRSLPHMDPL